MWSSDFDISYAPSTPAVRGFIAVGSPAITLNVYGHLFKPDDRAAAIIDALATREE